MPQTVWASFHPNTNNSYFWNLLTSHWSSSSLCDVMGFAGAPGLVAWTKWLLYAIKAKGHVRATCLEWQLSAALPRASCGPLLLLPVNPVFIPIRVLSTFLDLSRSFTTPSPAGKSSWNQPKVIAVFWNMIVVVKLVQAGLPAQPGAQQLVLQLAKHLNHIRAARNQPLCCTA